MSNDDNKINENAKFNTGNNVTLQIYRSFERAIVPLFSAHGHTDLTTHHSPPLSTTTPLHQQPRMEYILERESAIIEWLKWPTWAMRTIELLSLLIGILSLLQSVKQRRAESTTAGAHAQTSSAFRLFQVQYLTVYLMIMCADWLQGTNMYTLYAVSIPQSSNSVSKFFDIFMFFM